MKLEWRMAVQGAMRDAAEQEAKKANDGVLPSFNYRWEHVANVVTMARKLAQLVGADEEVVEAAAWLHDITKVDGEDHAETGATFARQFLPKTDFPPHKIEEVAQAILEHVGLWRDSPLSNLESMVLWDADKLSKTGLTAAFHWAGMAISQEEEVTMADLIANRQNASWQARTVVSFHTESARKAGEKRFMAFNRLWDELEAELNAEDLD
ncbi:MAG: HD domain-containing protein [Chloroflexota bacterium]